MPAEPFTLIYASHVKVHLQVIERRFHSLIREAVETQLRVQPDTETRNRKPLKRPVAFEADWELRCGPNNRFRVFYEIDMQRREVHVLAIGVKEGSQLLIGGQDVNA